MGTREVLSVPIMQRRLARPLRAAGEAFFRCFARRRKILSRVRLWTRRSTGPGRARHSVKHPPWSRRDQFQGPQRDAPRARNIVKTRLAVLSMPNSPVLGAQRALGRAVRRLVRRQVPYGRFVADVVAPLARLVWRSMALSRSAAHHRCAAIGRSLGLASRAAVRSGARARAAARGSVGR
jgi:hypothetical protein